MRITKLQQLEINQAIELINKLDSKVEISQDKNILSLKNGFNSTCLELVKGFISHITLAEGIARTLGDLKLKLLVANYKLNH